eukprot:gene25584-34147_t
MKKLSEQRKSLENLLLEEWQYVVVSVFKMEGLPVMDGKAQFVSDAKTDAYCQLSFAGGKVLKSKVVTVKGETSVQINPEFNIEMWYPVSIPTMTQQIKFSVWDDDTTSDELIANIYEKFSALQKNSTKLRWYNMYGAWENKNAKAIETAIKATKEAYKIAKRATGLDINWHEYYNNVPEKASTFKGRALLKFRIEHTRPARFEKKPENLPFRLMMPKENKVSKNKEPKRSMYILRAMFIAGTELPMLGITSHYLKVQISIGPHTIISKADWNQLPDIFIHLIQEPESGGKGKPICFKRLKPVKDHKTGELMGFDQPAQWYSLQEDKAIDALNADVFPGSLLLKLGFGLESDKRDYDSEWSECLSNATKNFAYQVRVHVYQCRHLPAADTNGLCDPSITVNFMGKTHSTKTEYKTLNPCYYETFIFDGLTIPAADKFLYAPQVTFQLYDHDFGTTKEYLGMCSYHLKNAQISDSIDDPLRDPTWVPFFKEVEGDGEGEILVSVQLIPGASPGMGKKSIIPLTKKAFVEFIVIGARDIAPFNFQSMHYPFMDIQLDTIEPDKKGEIQIVKRKFKASTKPSKLPDPSNPNFLEKIMMPVDLPLNSLFTTPLKINVRDTRLGGYLKPVVGVCQIDLTNKIPWCEETYKPPRCDIFVRPALKELENAKIMLESSEPGDAFDIELANMASERDLTLQQDTYIITPEPIKMDRFLSGRLAEDDTGAGVFGALAHLAVFVTVLERREVVEKFGKTRKKNLAIDPFTDPDWTENDDDQPPAWLT